MPDEVQDFNAFLTAAATPVVETPETPATPEPEAVPVEVEAPEVAEVAEDAALAAAETPETPEGEAAPEAEEHKRSRAAEKRIADLVKERERLKGQVAALSQQKQNVPQPQAQIMDPATPPDPANFDDPVDYKVELRLWQRDQQAKVVAFQARQKEIIAAHPELPELIESVNALDAQGTPTANPTVVSLIRDSEAGAELWHYLLSHQDEAINIARLSPIQTAKAIGKIEAKLTAPAPAPAPRAETPAKKTLPAPIAPVKTVQGVRATPHEFTEY